MAGANEVPGMLEEVYTPEVMLCNYLIGDWSAFSYHVGRGVIHTDDLDGIEKTLGLILSFSLALFR